MAEPKEAKTKKIVMMAKISGTRDGEDWPDIGEEISLPVDEADTMLQQKQAVTPAQWKDALKK